MEESEEVEKVMRKVQEFVSRTSRWKDAGKRYPSRYAGIAPHTSTWFGRKRYDLIVQNASHTLRVGLKKLSPRRILTQSARVNHLSIPHDPEKRYWVEVAESNRGLVDSFRGALVEFLAFDRDRMPRLIGSGFIIATSPQAALVVSAKHVFSEGVLKAQRPIPGHAPSAIFIHPKDLDPSLEPDWLKVIYKGGTTPTMLNVIYLNYNDSFDLAACVLVPQENETITQRVMIPLDTGQPSVGAVVHMVSLDGIQVDERIPPQAQDGKGQLIVTSRRVSIRVGIVTGVYPTGFRQYKWPCFTTSIPAEPGMSGGFVYFPRENVTIAACGIVCADNSTEEARHNFFQCGESVIAFAWSTLALRLPLSFPSQPTEYGHSLYEMIRLGHVPLPLGGIDQIRVMETGNGDCRIARLS